MPPTVATTRAWSPRPTMSADTRTAAPSAASARTTGTGSRLGRTLAGTRATIVATANSPRTGTAASATGSGRRNRRTSPTASDPIPTAKTTSPIGAATRW
jgi:hypothetical protein